MEHQYHISSSPHIRDTLTTNKIMQYVILALLPTTLFGVVYFGLDAVILLVLTIGSTVFFEYFYEKILHLPITIKDGSAFLTGLLLAINLPVSAPWWIGILGGAFAIVVVKMLFGGLGQNFMNPALGARCFLVISFTSYMTDFSYDAFSGATPLAELKTDGILSSFDLMDLFVGTIPGTIGETSVIAILLGAAFLVYKKVIRLTIPVSILVSFSAFILLFGSSSLDIHYLLCQLCSGGIMLGAWFMATDYVTSPISDQGRIIFGIIIGLLIGIFRIFGASSEGVSYAIIFANLLVPLIDKISIPKPFGKGGPKNG
ncbi:RnfABCDGE type electron transport complex subunit D [Tannockella kyphosi]|uniref:RnfABCDGE type electron transport complex subunit D n=1 Tax=Tannockella kyphosi TaxID=2899121 RepID=UPI00201316DC|nr:RnfABCDGE type electron transport complex subunit D [Tannockella kyphosi]